MKGASMCKFAGKIDAIKDLRNTTGMSLLECYDFVSAVYEMAVARELEFAKYKAQLDQEIEEKYGKD
jgi:ribosomal protein L7/L12